MFDYQFLILFGVVLWAIYKYLTKNLDFFEKRGVQYMKSHPLFGYMYEVMFKQTASGHVMKKAYENFSDAS